MQLKMIAIGILALLGLSSVMKPRAFRTFLGGIGAVCMVGLLSLITTRPTADEASKPWSLLTRARQLIEKEPAWTESAEHLSQQVLEDLRTKMNGENGVPADTPEKEIPKPSSPPKGYHAQIEVSSDGRSREQTKIDLVAQIQNEINNYLNFYRAKNQFDPGVDLLSHSDLNPAIIPYKWDLRFNRDRKLVNSRLTLSFGDERFVQHVREQGRKKIIRMRMELTAVIAAACGGLLFAAYGVLKVLNRREQNRRTDDYLTQSNVSLV